METTTKTSITLYASTRDARKTITPSGRVLLWKIHRTHTDMNHGVKVHIHNEGGVYVECEGYNWRKFNYTDNDGNIHIAAVRERKGLKALLATIRTQEDWERTPRSPLLSGNVLRWHSEARERTVTYTAQVKEGVLEDHYVCWMGMEVLIEPEPFYPAEMWKEAEMRSVSVRRYSPVKSEKTPFRMKMEVPYAWSGPELPGRNFAHNDEPVEWLSADGSVAFTGAEIARGSVSPERRTAWRTACQKEFLHVERTYHMRNGVMENASLRQVLCGPWMTTTELLSTKASSILNPDTPGEDQPTELVNFYLRRVAFKEALAMAVFAPARVDRMTQAYGEDWMERV
jgi:hypothetical protein